jgi:hypothetical protein
LVKENLPGKNILAYSAPSIPELSNIGRHDTQHNDIQQNDTLHKGLIYDTNLGINDTQHNNTTITLSVIMLSGIMLSVTFVFVVMLTVVILGAVGPQH